MNSEPDFYIGYLPNAPAGLRAFVRRVILGLGFLAVILALVFSFGQMPFAESYFEFGKLRNFQGTLVAQPYPTLIVSRPGQTNQRDRTSEYLLVAPGKHGADDLVRGFVDKNVRLRGQLIYRDGKTMVEVEPDSIHELNGNGTAEDPLQDLETVSITGEIVDSKCYLGVMNPGNGKVHRDCASRCLNGGIPPLFVESKSGKQFVLVSNDGKALPYMAIKDFIAEPLTIRGELLQKGQTQLLRIEPGQLRHIE